MSVGELRQQKDNPVPEGLQGQRRLWDIGDIVKLIEDWEADEPQMAVV